MRSPTLLNDDEDDHDEGIYPQKNILKNPCAEFTVSKRLIHCDKLII